MRVSTRILANLIYFLYFELTERKLKIEQDVSFSTLAGLKCEREEKCIRNTL